MPIGVTGTARLRGTHRRADGSSGSQGSVPIDGGAGIA
jgi:hypothetical protein